MSTLKPINLSGGSTNGSDLLTINGSGKSYWVAEILAYTPTAKFDLERNFIQKKNETRKETDYDLTNFKEGRVYEVSRKNYQGNKDVREFFTVVDGEVKVLKDKEAAVALLGAEINEEATKGGKIKRLLEQRNALMRRNVNDYDSGVDDMSRADYAKFEAIEAQLKALGYEE